MDRQGPALALIAAAALLAGCPTGEPVTAWTLETVTSSVTWDDETGLLSMADAAGSPVLIGAGAFVQLDDTAEGGPRLAMSDDRERTVEQDAIDTALGAGDRLRITRVGAEGEPDLVWSIVGYADTGVWTFDLTTVNTTGGELQLAKTGALEIPRDRASSLLIGMDPARHRILENGHYTVIDFICELRTGDTPVEPGWSDVVPGHYLGHSVSNWNHAIVDLDGGPAWIAGALSMTASSPVFNLSYEASWATAAEDGRTPFTYFSAEEAYEPHPIALAAGATKTSETYRVHPAEPDPLIGLERHADDLAAWLGKVPWHRRVEGRRIPNGWNSWSGSGSTGGHGTNIDEDLMIESLDVMATELRDWGFEWFQIDDGYEPTYGDWWWREDRFPNGPAWLSQQIRDRGLKPGLWMAPLTLHDDSQTAAEHPDWLADRTPVGTIVGSDYFIFDLTHPEVQAYLTDLFDTFRNEWGFDWFKMDFAYYALFGDGFYEPMTREEAWSEGMRAIREGLGEDAFFLGVGGLGLNYAHLDSMRLTLDSMPIWDHDPEYGEDEHMTQQGLKPTVRTAGRRWYLQDRLWINHNDLIFFRSNDNDETWPTVTHEEARAFATFIGLGGGIVKIGDRLIDLEADGINVLRQLVPIHPAAARPLDLFEREYPEQWWLPITETFDGYDESWHLVGLFDWGANEDLTTNPFTYLPDDGEGTDFSMPLDRIGLEGSWLGYEFWTGEFLGEISGSLDVTVPSHDSRVVALRQPTGAPQFLGWNRQISMGGTVLQQASWDEASGTLTFVAEAAADTDLAPFVHEAAFFVPADYTFGDATPSGVDLDVWEVVDEGDVVRIRYAPEQTGTLTVVLGF